MPGPISTILFKASKDGTDIPDVQKWTFNPTSENQAYASSQTAGWRKRLPGIKDATITIECLGNDTTRIHSLVKAGQLITTLALYENGTLNYSGPAIVDSVTIDVDGQTGAPSKVTINCSANGAWTDWT